MKLMRFLAASALLALAACKPAATDKPATPAAAAKPPLVTVNGKPISNELFENYVKAVTQGKSSGDLTADQREDIRDNLVRIELLAQQAEKDGLDKDPDVATRLEINRLNILQQAVAKHYLQTRLPTDAEVHAEYEAQIASTPLVEYHARHILVSSPDVAQKIIEQLKGGADFASLAKKFSSDAATAGKAGDLGWFSPSDTPKPFGDALAQLKNGEYTHTPVQSQSGWHVIQLVGTRDRAPPSFEGVQDQVKQILLGKKIKAYSDDMVRAAKIEPPLAKMPPPAAAPATSAGAPIAPIAPAAPAVAPKP
jgi:peptidyl-prolyl cis-trans isomerase C